MQLTSSIFSDPSARPALQQYYEDKKAAAIEAWKARDLTNMPDEVSMTLPDGQVVTGKIIRPTAEQVGKALVSFDKWVEIMAQTYDTDSKSMAMAQERVDRLEEQSPGNSSGVRSTFSANGVLLAYVTEDGEVVTSNGAEEVLGALASGGSVREIRKALAEKYPGLTETDYSEGNSPSIRDFAKMWSKGYDADQVYNAAMTEARAHLESMSQWHRQLQKNLDEMQSYFLSMQETTAAPLA